MVMNIRSIESHQKIYKTDTLTVSKPSTQYYSTYAFKPFKRIAGIFFIQLHYLHRPQNLEFMKREQSPIHAAKKQFVIPKS